MSKRDYRFECALGWEVRGKFNFVRIDALGSCMAMTQFEVKGNSVSLDVDPRTPLVAKSRAVGLRPPWRALSTRRWRWWYVLPLIVRIRSK